MFPSFLLILIITVQVLSVLSCVPCKYDTTTNKIIANCRGVPSVTVCKFDNIPMNLNPDTTTLRLEQQPIKILQNNVFLQANIYKIEKLYMDSCKLQTIERDALKNLTKLEIFSAAFNNISELLVGTFDDNIRLDVLNFSSNSIKELKNGLFDKAVYLRVLRLERNHIHHVGAQLFNHNLKLKKLILSYNKLTYIDANVFEKLKQELKLSIDNNPWKCNCSLWKFHQMSLKLLGNRPILPQCANRMHLIDEKYSWENLKETDFTCKASIQFYTIPLPKSNEITLICKVLANPRPTSLNLYSSAKGEKVFISSNVTQSTQKEFTFFNSISIKIEPKSIGLYTCVANQNHPSKTSVNKSITIEEIQQRVAARNGRKDPPPEMLDPGSTEAINMNNIPIDLRINLGNTANLECSSREPLKTSWYFRGFPIDEQVISRAKDKYKITQDSSKSVLTVTNIFIEDQGLYACKNSVDNNEEIHFMLSVMDTTIVPNRLLAISLGTIFCILLIVFIITLCYFKCKNHQDIQNLNRTVNRNSTNDYVSNKNEYMVESSIYDSSDNNIYEDIIYGPAGK